MNLEQGNIEDNESIGNISSIKENIEKIKKLKHPKFIRLYIIMEQRR